MAWLFSHPCTIDIQLDDEDHPQVEIPKEKGPEKLYLFIGNQPVKGKVTIEPHHGKKIEHKGIKIELIGQIELFYARDHYPFMTLESELASAGILAEKITYSFDFSTAEKQYESYNGVNVRLRYFLRVIIARPGLNMNITKEMDFWVYNYTPEPEINNTIKMEVGIEDCLHIEFEYNKSKYHLKDVIIGKIYFLLVRIKVKHMELALIKKEITGLAPNTYNESETMTRYEIMDGAPVRGESIPVRMFLGGLELTPSYKSVHNKFSLRYFLNLVLVDEDDRRYFKQQEITLWRREPKKGSKKKREQSSASKGKPTTSETASTDNSEQQQQAQQQQTETQDQHSSNKQ